MPRFFYALPSVLIPKLAGLIEARGEQPDEAIHSLLGAMRGDIPLS